MDFHFQNKHELKDHVLLHDIFIEMPACVCTKEACHDNIESFLYRGRMRTISALWKFDKKILMLLQNLYAPQNLNILHFWSYNIYKSV